MLTEKQEQFVRNIIEGMNQADAYRSAYPNNKMSDKTVWEAASRLMKNDKVVARLSELRGKLTNEAIMSAQKRLEWLTDKVNDENIDINARLKALDIMNKMQGEYTQKIEANVVNEVTINVELVEDE